MYVFPDLEKEFLGLPSDVDVAVGSAVVLACQAPKGLEAVVGHNPTDVVVGHTPK